MSFFTFCGSKVIKIVYNICGHTHTKDKFVDMDKGYIYHAEVDAHNIYPVLLEQIQKDILTFEKS